MARLTDKEVGELWKYLWNDEPVHEVSAHAVVNLIRKLVEERALVIYREIGDDNEAFEDRKQHWIDLSCEELGIDPEGF